MIPDNSRKQKNSQEFSIIFFMAAENSRDLFQLKIAHVQTLPISREFTGPNQSLLLFADDDLSGSLLLASANM